MNDFHTDRHTATTARTIFFFFLSLKSDLCFWREKDALHWSFRIPKVKFSLAVSFFLSLNWYSTKKKADLIKDSYLQFMLNLFKGNLTLYAEFHLHDERATAAYAQCLEIWLRKMKASSQEMGYATKQQYCTLPVYLLFSREFWEYICSIKFRNGQMEILSLHSSPKHSQVEQSTKHYSERQIWTITWKKELTDAKEGTLQPVFAQGRDPPCTQLQQQLKGTAHNIISKPGALHK